MLLLNALILPLAGATTLTADICLADDPAIASRCNAYTIGVYAALVAAQTNIETRDFCLPKSFSPRDINEAVKSYLAASRGKMKDDILATPYFALALRFPCAPNHP